MNGLAPADEPTPCGEKKLLTMECVIPKTHMPGQKLVWVSPVGQKVALTVPETAKPGQTLEFQIPASIVNGGSPGASAMSPAEDVAASSPAARLPDRDDEQATLEIVIPADWKEGVKLATTLENGQRVIITPPDGAKAGMSLEFNVPASNVPALKAEGSPASPQAAALPPAVPAPEEAPQESEAPPARPTAVVEQGTGPAARAARPASEQQAIDAAQRVRAEQAAAQVVTSTVKVPVTYSKSELSEMYAQKTVPPWVKRASGVKYSIEAVRSKVPVVTVTGRDHAEVADRV